jgi:UDP-2,3-diacylglucosamine hydrolase
MKKIGIIAGGGQFPVIFSEAAKSKGFEVYAAAHFNETDPQLENHVHSITWIHPGQLKRIIKFFKKDGVTEAVMMGSIAKPKLFKTFRPDTKAISLIAGMRHTHDDGILRALADLFKKEGITIEASTNMLPDILAKKGCWTKRKPTRAEKKDIVFGWDIAKEIGRLDIGQCVVTGGGSILAVEAVDGTDATIKRGGSLGDGTAIVVKVSKPNQDLRFDMPAVGVRTIQIMDSVKARVLAVEAGKTIVFEKDKMVELADKCGISIVGIDPKDN